MLRVRSENVLSIAIGKGSERPTPGRKNGGKTVGSRGATYFPPEQLVEKKNKKNKKRIKLIKKREKVMEAKQWVPEA